MNRSATVALTALAPISWGSTYAVASELLPPDRPLFTGVMRALPAGLLLVALSRTLPKGAWWWKSAVLGALNIGAFFPLLFLSAYRLPGGVAAVLGSAGPLFVVGLAALVLGERASLKTVLAAVTGAFGVSMVVLTADAELDLVGLVAGVISSASMAAGTVMTKRWGRPAGVGPLAMTGWQLTAGGLIIIPVAALVEGAARPRRQGLPRLRVHDADQHRDRVLALVPRHRSAHRHLGHPARPAVPADRGRHRLGGARSDAVTRPAGRDGDRLRGHRRGPAVRRPGAGGAGGGPIVQSC